MAKSFSFIVTYCDENGVQSFDDHHALPWKKFLLQSLKTFSEECEAQNKKEIVLILRSSTYNILGPLPFKNVKQIVLSTNRKAREDYDISENVPIYTCLHQALLNIPYDTEVYVTGATLVDESVKHPYCKRIYSTKILKNIPCYLSIRPFDLNIYFLQNSSCVKQMDDFEYKFLIHERYAFHFL